MKADLTCGHQSRSIPRNFLKRMRGFWCPTCGAVKARVPGHGPPQEFVTVKKPSGKIISQFPGRSEGLEDD